jgi:tRNA A-37 threonylcarbamoyl transferase component Bud32/tetratricopeptide (TPR) repeat protein
MALTCPHCQSPVEQADQSLEEIRCPACGSSFRLEHDTTVAWASARGQRTIGKYELIEAVGTGGFGTVYKARDPQLDRTVALKVPRSGRLADQTDVDRFLREARSVARLTHPAIVPVHDVGEHEGVPYLVSDFVQGMTLTDVLSARRLPPREAAGLVSAVADALQYAHEQGIIHRDVKPSNILLDGAGRPHLMDFGLARRDAGDVTMTTDGQVLGTPAYMSPEQARGEGHRVDGRSDVYSLGVVLYQMLTAELPFRGTPRMLLHQVLNEEPRSVRSLNDRVPRDLETICLKAMAKEPPRRYATAGEMAADVRRFLAGELIRARRTGPAERAWRWAKRSPVIAALSTAIAVLLCAGIGGLWYGYRSSQQALKVESGLRAEADRRADEARAITTFFTTLLDQATEPGYAKGQAVTVDDLVAKADEMLATGSFDDQPLVEAELRHKIGWIHLRLFRFERAEPQLRRALEIRTERLGPDHQDTLLSQTEYAWVLDGMGRRDESQRQIERCWQLTRRRFGPDNPGTRRVVASFLNMSLFHGSGDRRQHLALLEEALRATSRLSPKGKEAESWESEFLVIKQRLLQLEGRLAEARQLAEDLRSRPRRDTGTEFDSSLELAELDFALGEWGKAESRMQQVLEVSETRYPGTHWTVWKPRALLVRVAQERQEWERAQWLLEGQGELTEGSELRRTIDLAKNAALRGDLDCARTFRDRWLDLSRQSERREEEYLISAADGLHYYPQLATAALLDVLCGNLDRARGRCDRLLGYGLPGSWIGPRFGLWALNDLSRTLATAPQTRDHPEDSARAVAMAEMIVAAQPEVGYFKTTLSMARYRAGDFAGAIDALTTAERLRRDENTAAIHGLYLAMAYHRLDRPAEARSWLDRADASIVFHQPDPSALVALRTEAQSLICPARLDSSFPVHPFAR